MGGKVAVEGVCSVLLYILYLSTVNYDSSGSATSMTLGTVESSIGFSTGNNAKAVRLSNNGRMDTASSIT